MRNSDCFGGSPDGDGLDAIFLHNGLDGAEQGRAEIVAAREG